MLHRNAAGQIVLVPVTCPKHQKNLNIYADDLIPIRISEDLLSEQEIGKPVLPLPPPFSWSSCWRTSINSRAFLQVSPHPDGWCLHVLWGGTQGDIPPGFPNTYLGLTGRDHLQTKNGNTMVYSLLEFSSEQLGNLCQQLKQSLSSDMLLCVRYTRSTSDPVSKINTEGQRLILVVAETYEQTKIPLTHLSDCQSSITSMVSPFPNYLYVKLQWQVSVQWGWCRAGGINFSTV